MPNRFGLMGVKPRVYVPENPDAYLTFDFTRQRYRLNGVSARAFNSASIAGLSVARSHTNFTNAYAETAAGLLVPFAANVARITDKGLLVEEARTNSVRNSTGAGAVVGTPGTMPTNWFISWNNGGGGMSSAVAGTGTENGVPYVDIRVYGTAVNSNEAALVQVESSTGIAASVGQTWTVSTYARLISGAPTLSTIRVLEVGGAAPSTSAAWVLGSSMARASATRTLTDAAVTHVRGIYRLDVSQGVPADFTVRFYLPQIEQGAFATSPIPTTGSTATRGADSISLPVAPSAPYTVATRYLGAPSTANDARVWEMDDGTTAERAAIYMDTQMRALLTDGGASQALIALGTYTAGAVNRVAARFAANDVAAVANAGAVQTDASATMPTVSTLWLGRSFNGNALNNYLQTLALFASSKSNAELQALALAV